MRETDHVCRDAVQRAREGAGRDDIPRNAALLLSSLDLGAPEPEFSPQADVVTLPGLNKKMANQLIDTLVLQAISGACWLGENGEVFGASLTVLTEV